MDAKDLLDQLYSYNSAIPSIVFFIRKLHSTNDTKKSKKDTKDTTKDVKKTFNDIVELLCSVPFDEFEAKNRAYLYDYNQCEFLNKKRDKVTVQLEEIRKLDSQLTNSIIQMEQKISELRDKRAQAAELLVNNERMMDESLAPPPPPSGIESLFSSQTMFGFPSLPQPQPVQLTMPAPPLQAGPSFVDFGEIGISEDELVIEDIIIPPPLPLTRQSAHNPP